MRVIIFFLLVTISLDANAFWWLVRSALGRGAVANSVRAANQAGSLGALGARGARMCVRPVGATACDFHMANSSQDAVRRALGGAYRIRNTSRHNVFEIYDMDNNFIGSVQASSENDDPSISGFEQYQMNESLFSDTDENISSYPLRHNGDVLNIAINGRSVQIWSDGSIEVWTDNEPAHVNLRLGDRANIVGQGRIYALPKSGNSYNIFLKSLDVADAPRRNGSNGQNCSSGFQMINGQWVCGDQMHARRPNNLSSENCSSGYQMHNGRWVCMGNSNLSSDNCASGFIMTNGRWTCRGN